MAELTVSSDTPPGPLENLVLHPTTFPNTPYYTQCQHHTHRRERTWHVDIRVTTASNTGFRAAVLLLADPRMLGRTLPSSVIWSAVMNQTGAIATSTGTGSTRATFRVPATTPTLSNSALNSALTTTVGFAAGSIAVYLLDPPIGITGNSKVTVTVLARVELTLIGPITGFMAWTQDPTPGPGPAPPVPKPGFVYRMTKDGLIPLNSHTASAWLAGGCYWQLPDQPGDAHISGECWTFAVYQVSTYTPYNWQDNDSINHDPRYLVTWMEPGSPVLQIVGFVRYEDAKNQALGHTSLVGHGSENCITYHSTAVTFKERFRGLTADANVTFQLLEKTPASKMFWETKAPRQQTFQLPGLLPATSPGQVGMIAGSPLNQPNTSHSGLIAEINSLQSTVRGLQDICRGLISGLPPSSPPSLQSHPHQQEGTVSSWLRSLGNYVPWPSSLRQQQQQHSANLTPSLHSSGYPMPTTPVDTRSCSSGWSGWTNGSQPLSSYSVPPTLTTSPGIGYETSLSTSALPECPGCNNPFCNDCFEDDPDVVVDTTHWLAPDGSYTTAMSHMSLSGTEV